MNSCLSLCACGCDNKSVEPETEPVQTSSSANDTTSVSTTQSISTSDEADYYLRLNVNKLKQDSDVVEEKFNRIINEFKFKGTVYYKIGNDFEYIGSNGFSNKDTHSYNSLNTDYYIGSFTKQFTSAAILLLQEEGKLSTSDTIDKYFPDYKYGSEITIRNLLTMTDGIPDYLNKKDELTKRNTPVCDIKKDNTAEENHSIILNWIFSQELACDTDADYFYTNSGYYLLGDIIEKASGEKYEDYIRKNILEPLGMNSTEFEETEFLATGYQNVYDNEWTVYPGVAYSSAGLISNTGDMLKWIDALCGEEFLSTKSKEDLFTPYKSGYAYGVNVNDSGLYWNNSSIYRFNCSEYFNSDKSMIFLAFSNYAQADIDTLKKEFDKVLQAYVI